MQIRKTLIYSASILALMGVASETSTVQANPAGFAGELFVALSANQQKSNVKVSSSTISSPDFSYTMATLYKIVADGAAEDGISPQKVLFKDTYDDLVQNSLLSNVVEIINRDNFNDSITTYKALFGYNERLSSTTWTTEKSMTLGVKVAGALGFKIDRFSFKVGGFIDAPIMNKKVNVAIYKASTSNKNGSSNNNANANTASNPKSKVSLDIAEEKSMSFCGMGIIEYSITDRFTLGSEFGLMRLKNSYNLSRPNKDLLGIDGIPNGVDARGHDKQNKAFDRSDEYKTYNEVVGKGWVPYFALRFTYNFNKCFGLMVTGGYRGGTDLKLTSNGNEIKNPDYNIKVAPGFCGSFGVKISI